MLESRFKQETTKRIRRMFPGCVILKNDASYLQGVPDQIILYGNRWAMLEYKRELKAKTQPNQPYYVRLLNEMSFAAFIDPDNVEDILRELQQALEPCGNTRVSQR